MKNPLRLILNTLLLAGTASVYSQSTELMRLKAGETVTETSWRDSIYRFQDFQDGKIIFYNGISPVYKINYNLYFTEMDMIDDKGDTITVKDSKDLKLVSIKGHVFFHEYRKGYYEILVQLPIALAVKDKLANVRKEIVTNNGYGTSTENTSSVTSYRNNFRNPYSNRDQLFKRSKSYYFIDPDNRVHGASKSSLLKLFPNHKLKIEEYIEINNPDFRAEQDLISITRFCGQFQIEK
jgi:hypothetical protein